ncbi:trans-sialidase, putative, partial [Trypanosoma cruzi marinkellei]
RESERQRPNMSRHLFYSPVLLLLLVVMCCNTGGAASSEVRNSALESSEGKYFFWRELDNEKETVSLLRVPSLVEVDGGVFAVAEAVCTKNDVSEDDDAFTGIASELLTLDDGQKSEELDGAKLKTQVLEKCPSDGGKCASEKPAQSVLEDRSEAHVARPTTVVQGSEIYMLAGTYNLDGTTDLSAKTGLLLARGNVSSVGSTKRIYWNDIDALPSFSNIQQHDSLTDLIGGGGSGVKMKDGTLVLPVEGITPNNADGKTVSLVISSMKDNNSWTLSKGMSDGGCSDPSVVEWEKDKLIMMTACDDGRRRVYESGDKGESWTEALGTLSRVWGNKHEGPEKGVGSGFITATIGNGEGDGEDNRKVMLVTLPVYSSKNGERNEKGVLHLWLTDNTHIVDIGAVSSDAEDVTASSLLYKSGTNNEEKLIALYEKEEGGEESSSLGMVSVLLTEQLKRVKDVLATWKKVDDIVSKLCSSSIAAVSASPGTPCSADKITAGLVGFLSGNFSQNGWMDEYLGVN